MNRSTSILLLIGLITIVACKQTVATDKKSFKKEFAEKPVTTIDEKLLIGSWLDQSESKLHFSLLQNGTARSDNMTTLLYQKWRLDGTKLTLTVESIGNGNSSTGEETYEIKTLTKEKLILKDGDNLLRFIRKK